MGKCQQALLTAELLVHMKLSDLFRHRLRLVFSLIRKILINFEDAFNTEKAKNIHIDIKILKGRTELLTGSYNRGGKKCSTALYVGSPFWKDLVRSIKYDLSTTRMTGSKRWE